MYDRYNFFDYFLIDSHIHKLNYTYKILSVVLLLFCIVIADGIIDMFVINFFIFIIMLFSNISIKLYFNNLSIFKFLMIIIFLVFSLIYWNLDIGFIWMVKIFDIIMYISIINMTTSFGNIVYGIYNLIKPLYKFFDVSKISLKIGLNIKFISTLYNENYKMIRSKKLRGVRFNDMSFRDKISSGLIEFNCVYKLACRKIEELENIMYVKNYGISEASGNYRLNKWGKTDTILLVINVLVIIITFIY